MDLWERNGANNPCFHKPCCQTNYPIRAQRRGFGLCRWFVYVGGEFLPRLDRRGINQDVRTFILVRYSVGDILFDVRGVV